MPALSDRRLSEVSNLRLRSPCLLRWASAGLLAVLALSTPTYGQDEEDKGPFQEPGISYRMRSSKKAYLDWLAGTLLVAFCVVPAFKNPHRSHLD